MGNISMITKSGNKILHHTWLFAVNSEFRSLNGLLETQFLVFNIIDTFIVLLSFTLLLITVFKTFLTF